MDCALEVPTLNLQLDQAMALVRQDRWQLGAVRDGKLKVLADSSPDSHRPFRHTRSLSALARRCLYERRALTVASVAAVAQNAGDTAAVPDWEMDWPALLYAPVGIPGRRPVGLLITGSRTDHWYQQPEVDYVAALAVTMTGLVLSLGGPLTRLNRRELAAARLIAQGLSVPETSAALELGAEDARRLIGGVLRKLALRSPGQLVDSWPQLEPTGSYS
jgi:DNA-binding CsgD family transcriptional regulator